MSECRLVVVVTRDQVSRGGHRDEFVVEWGLDAEASFEPYGLEKGLLLVIHGREVGERWSDDLSGAGATGWSGPIYLFCHNVDEEQEQRLLEKLGIADAKPKSESYSSRGVGSALDGLRSVMESKGLGDLAQDCLDKAQGLVVIQQILMAIQRALLDVWFGVALEQDAMKDLKPWERVKDIRKLASRNPVTKIDDKLPKGNSDLDAARKSLFFLRGSSKARAIPGLTSGFWDEWSDRGVYLRPIPHEQLRGEFMLLSRYIDTLAEALTIGTQR